MCAYLCVQQKQQVIFLTLAKTLTFWTCMLTSYWTFLDHTSHNPTKPPLESNSNSIILTMQHGIRINFATDLPVHHANHVTKTTRLIRKRSRSCSKQLLQNYHHTKCTLENGCKTRFVHDRTVHRVSKQGQGHHFGGCL